MASNKQRQIILIVCIFKQSFALDFESAVKDGRFQEITMMDIDFTMNPSTAPSVSLYYDDEAKNEYSRESHPASSPQSAKIEFDLAAADLDHNDDFTIGISVVFLKFSASFTGSLRITIDRDYYEHKHEDEEINDSHNKTVVYINQAISLPEEKYEQRSIVRSYDQATSFNLFSS